MKELILFLLEGITGKTIELQESEDNGVFIYEIKCEGEDAGIIIGKGGKTIKALQDIVRVRGKIENIFVSLKVESLQ